MIFISFKLFFDSINSLIFKNTFIFSWVLVIVCIITIIIKLLLFLYTNYLAKKFNSILIESNKKDHRNDCFITTCTLISVLLSLWGIYWFDGLVGIGISIWIFITGIKIFIDSYNILMDISIDRTTKNSILKIAHSYKQIKRVDSFSSTPVGYQYFISLTICVDGTMSTFESHSLADKLEKSICKIDTIYGVTVHVNPY